MMLNKSGASYTVVARDTGEADTEGADHSLLTLNI